MGHHFNPGSGNEGPGPEDDDGEDDDKDDDPGPDDSDPQEDGGDDKHCPIGGQDLGKGRRKTCPYYGRWVLRLPWRRRARAHLDSVHLTPIRAPPDLLHCSDRLCLCSHCEVGCLLVVHDNGSRRLLWN